MSSKSSLSQSHSRQKLLLICLLLVSLTLLFFLFSLEYKELTLDTNNIIQVDHKPKPIPIPPWFDIIAKDVNNKNYIFKVGLVNFNARVNVTLHEQVLDAFHPKVETKFVDFDHVDENLKWGDFFPEWIDEDEKWDKPKCPNMPMPILKNYEDLNVVVAKIPCGIKDVFRLQVNLVVANLAVESGWLTKMGSGHRKVYVVFVGSCGPMEEIFKCDDLLMHQGEYWVYMPDLMTLKHQTLMPHGSCQIATPYAQTGKEFWRKYTESRKQSNRRHVAYVTVLHSSEAYVCGAIALAQSILKSTYQVTSDLVLLADKSIGSESIKGLKAAGWKIKRIERILNPFAKKGSYNEWNYSKLRIWQLTKYQKLIFLDSDFLVLRNLDHLFAYPQLSASPNELTLFNSGLMVIEPSQCMFHNMMDKTSKVHPYNGGDQGFLNEVFTWWHRLPAKLNYLKTFGVEHNNDEVPHDAYTIHYLGVKPWQCYRDYDCNWDMLDRHIFASDSAHNRWWKVYDSMPQELQSYCGLTEKMNQRIVMMRRQAKNANLSDGHWKIKVKDPRRQYYYSDN